jgi:hypothetical protein
VRKPFRTIGEGADDEGLGGSHCSEYSGPADYGTNSDLGSTFTIQSPELMSGT